MKRNPKTASKPVVAVTVQRETVMHYVGRMLHAIFGERLPDEDETEVERVSAENLPPVSELSYFKAVLVNGVQIYDIVRNQASKAQTVAEAAKALGVKAAWPKQYGRAG